MKNSFCNDVSLNKNIVLEKHQNFKTKKIITYNQLQNIIKQAHMLQRLDYFLFPNIAIFGVCATIVVSDCRIIKDYKQSINYTNYHKQISQLLKCQPDKN